MGNFIFNEYVNVFKNGGEYIADNDTNLGVALIKSCPFNCTYKSLDSIKEYVAIDYNITIPEIYGVKSLDGVELAYNEIGVDANVLIKAFSAIFEGETWFSACGCVIFRNKDGSTVVEGEYPEGETELIAYYDFGEQVVTEGTPFKIIWKGASEIDPESKGTVIVYTPELTDIYESMTNQGQVKTTSADEHMGYLFDKLAEGDGIGLVVENEKVVITNTKEDFIKSISSTDSVILSATSGDLSGYVRVSESSGNILSVSADGLYVPETEIPEVPVKSILEGEGIQIDDDGNGNFTVNATTEVQSISSVSGINAVPDTSGTWNIGILLSEDEGNKAKFSENDNGLYVGTDMPDFTSADEGKILTPNTSGELEWRLLTGIHAPNAEIEATEGTTLLLDSTRNVSAHADYDMFTSAEHDIYVKGGNKVSTSASSQISRTAPYITDTVSNQYALITGEGTGFRFVNGQLGIDGSTLTINETVGITETTSGSMELKGLRFSAEAYASANQGTKYESNPNQAEIWSRNPNNRSSVLVANSEVLAKVNDNNGVNSSIDILKNKITMTTSGDSDHYVTVQTTSSLFEVSAACTPSSNTSPCSLKVGNNAVVGSAERINLIASNLPNRPSASIVLGLPTAGTVVMMTSAGIEANTVNLTVNSTSAVGVSATNENSVYSDSVFIRNSHWYDDEEERGGYRNFVGMNSNGVSLETESLKVLVRDKEGTDEWPEHAEINAVHDGNLVLKKTDGYETSGFLVIGNTKSELFAINENDVRTSYSVSTSSLEQNANFTETNYYASNTTSAYQTNILNGDISTYPYIQNAVYTTSSDGTVTTTKYAYQVIHSGGISLYSNAQGSISMNWNGTNESGSVQLGSLGTQNVQIFGRNGVKISALNDTCRVYLGWSDTIVHGTNTFLETNNDQIGITNSGVNVNAKNPVLIHTETSAPIEVRSGATSGSYSQLYMQGTNFSAMSYGDASNYGMLTLSPSHVYLGVDPVVGNHSGMDIGVTTVTLSAYATSANYSTMMMTPGNIMTVMMNGQISQKSVADSAQCGWETTPSRFKVFTSADSLVSEMTMTPASYSVGVTSGSATIRAEELNLAASSTNGNTPIVNVVASSGDITFVSSNMMINAATRLTSATSAAIVDVEDQSHGSDDLNGILATSYDGGQMFRFGVKKDTIRTSATADNETIPTEKAVRAAIDAASSGGTEWYCGSFTTANRPSNPTEGQYGYDTTIDCVIYYIGGEWKNSAGATV